MRTISKILDAMPVDAAETRSELLRLMADHCAAQLMFDCQDIRPVGYRIRIEAYESQSELPWNQEEFK